MIFKRVGISMSLILLVISAPVRGRADDLSGEDVEESCAVLDEATAYLTEDELLDILTSINIQTLAAPFWMYTPEEDAPALKDRENRFALLLLLGLFSDIMTDERGGGLNLFVGPTQPGPGFPPPGGGTPGGGTNSPNFNLPNPFPTPEPNNTTLNNPFSQMPGSQAIPEPMTLILVGVGLCAIAGYRLMRRKRLGASLR
jgi:hypothetical protein